VYDADRENETCVCGTTISKARIQASPLVEYNVDDQLRASPIFSSFEFVSSLRASTMLKGSKVIFKPEHAKWNTVYFNLSPALYYGMATRGIRWTPPISGIENSTQALKTAGRILLRTMAAITGVTPDRLEVTENEENKSVTVWERIEGGAGLSEVFRDVLTRDPQEIYAEMVSTISCPIYLGEQQDNIWKDGVGELLSFLSDKFHLPEEHPSIQHIVSEAYMETAPNDPEYQALCTQNDGCPACVRYGQGEREEEKTDISRQAGWKIIENCVRTVSTNDPLTPEYFGRLLFHDVRQGSAYLLAF
jgi:hypothetical protein